ncbi:MAG: hypothetical protein U0746_18545 [Gemmataceae bacterium]
MMKLHRRFQLAAASLALATAGVAFAHPSLASELGLDFWNMPSLHQQIAHDKQFRIELERRDELSLRRIDMKEQIIRKLIGGKIELLEAAADFRALNRSHPEVMKVVRFVFAAPTEDETMCLNVIAFVDAWAQFNPSLESTAQRLRSDLDRHRCAGTLKLPAVSLDDED